MVIFDRLDRKLLHELDLDAKQSYSKLSKKIRLGSDLVEYRIQRFLRKGIIKNFTPIIHPATLGVGIFKTYLKHNMDSTILKEFIKDIDLHPMTYWLCEGHGAWDILFSLAAKDVSNFQAAQDRLLEKYGKYILDLSVSVPTTIVRYPKHYLVGKGSKKLSWSDKKPRKVVGELERRILAILSRNCRTQSTVIADELETTATVVSYRIKKMESDGVILGYRTQLNYESIGMMVFKVFLELRDYSPKTRVEIQEHCRNEPHVTCYIEQIGNSQIEFEVESNDYYHFARLMEIFKSSFGQNLGKIEYMLIKKDYYHRVPKTSSLK